MDAEFFDEAALYIWEFKNKQYPHFDVICPEKRVHEIINGIEQGTLSHSFYPLIRIPKRKIKREGQKIINAKRDIFHTARIDSNIYSHYRSKLMNRYEVFLHEHGINDCVIAYRKIPVKAGGEKNKCNLHFANEAIDKIISETNCRSGCVAIAMDISGFFDNLDHQEVKCAWRRVMGFEFELPQDHFNVYKAITKYSYIDKKQLEKILDIKLKQLSGNKRQICTPKVFREKIKGQVQKSDGIGIPQGTPISDVLANIYMINFDELMQEFAKKYGYYRRYSDDILFICAPKYCERAINFIKETVEETAKNLKINDRKTRITVFTKSNKNKIDSKTYNGNRKGLEGKIFEYLGLAFDGAQKLIRQSTKSHYEIKLCHGIRDEVNFARYKLIYEGYSNPSPEQVYNKINFKKIRNTYLANRDGKAKKGYFGGFYNYIKLFADITGNYDAMDIFDWARKVVKRKALLYCKRKWEKRAKKLEKLHEIKK